MRRNEHQDGDTDGASERVGDHVRIYRRGQIWYANFQCDRRQQRTSLETVSKKEAMRRALRIEGELGSGRWKQTLTVTGLDDGIKAYEDYYHSQDHAAKTISKYDGHLARVAALARERKIVLLSGINLSFIDAYRKMRKEKGKSAKTIYNEIVLIRQLVNFALSRDLLTTDPLKGLKLKKPKPTPQPCWTYEQVQEILKASPPEISAALTLLAETGMRFGELAWLTWADITDDTLRVQPKSGWKPKSGDRRSIPLTPVARAALDQLPRLWKWVVTMPPTRQRPECGRQWEERRLLAALKRVLKDLKLPGKLHTFRHSFISNALLRGTPVAVVREWVGHVDDDILRMYTHVHEDSVAPKVSKTA